MQLMSDYSFYASNKVCCSESFSWSLSVKLFVYKHFCDKEYSFLSRDVVVIVHLIDYV